MWLRICCEEIIIPLENMIFKVAAVAAAESLLFLTYLPSTKHYVISRFQASWT